MTNVQRLIEIAILQKMVLLEYEQNFLSKAKEIIQSESI